MRKNSTLKALLTFVFIIVTFFSISISKCEAKEYTEKCTMQPLYSKCTRYYDQFLEKAIKPTKKELLLAKKMYKQIKNLKKGKQLIYTNISEVKFERLCAILNGKYFPYNYAEFGCGCNEKYGDFFYITYKNAHKVVKENKEIKKYVKNVIKSLRITKNTTQYEAIIRINDYLINRIEYGNLSARHDMNTTYAALKSKKGLCYDYAVCFQLLTQYCGIKTGYVDCYVREYDDGYHACNVVKLQGDELFVDVCWNDDGTGRNNWLFVTRSKMQETRDLYEAVYYLYR